MRVNERIRAREVRLIDEDGQPLGIMTPMQALSIARERDLDLVEVSPMATPPVCRLMDYGRFKYEQAKRENEARKNQKTTDLKEIRLSPRTDDHDLNVKIRKAEEFLGDGDKVKVSVRLRGRENAHPELGRQLLDKIIEALKHAAVVERPPIMEARVISMILSKAPGWEPQKTAAASGTHARKGAKSGSTPATTTPEAAPDAPAAEATPDTTSAEQTPSTPS
ncbi:MAG TPA: translation initiation factor IF-3 [Ktedonobacterales bacterium]